MRETEIAPALLEVLRVDYEVGSLLGTGGFGYVFRGVYRRTGQAVAIKVMAPSARPSEPPSPSRLARFRREADLCAGLQHPNIVRLLDRGGAPGGAQYAVFELVPGETLRQLLHTSGPLSVATAVEVMAQVLDALSAAHARGIVHRDLKPENIMVTTTASRLHAKVLDFGIGTLVPEAREEGFRSLTLTQETLGTPLYTAPEQLRGEPPTTRSDLYAWALVLLECITGYHAIAGTTVAQIHHQHLSPLEVTLPPALAAHPLGDFLRRLLEKRPEQRASDAGALYAEFRALHLADLVGKFDVPPLVVRERGHELRATAPPTIGMRRSELRHVMAVAVCFRLVPEADARLELDEADALQRELLSSCRDVFARFGGATLGTLGDRLVVYFGYPVASDTDARRATSALLSLARQLARQNELALETLGVRIELRVGVHVGTVLVCGDTPPDGITPSVALNLCDAAPAGSALVSDAARPMMSSALRFSEATLARVNGRSEPLRAHRMSLDSIRESDLLGASDQAGPVVGRERELARLRAAWGRACRGAGGAILLRGEPGIGKSRLCQELGADVRAQGRAVMQARCLPEHKNGALFPILELLRSQWRLDEAAGGAMDAQVLERRLVECELDPGLLRIFCTWLSLPCPSGRPACRAAPGRQRELLIQALVSVLRRRARSSSALLLVEDLHWADPTTLDLLGSLLSELGESHLLVVCTARPPCEGVWPSEGAVVEDLGRLSPDDCQRLVEQRFRGRAVDPAALDAVARRADGIPLFVEELCRMLAEDSSIWDGNAMVWSRRVFSRVPVTLRGSLEARLMRQGPACELAQVAAAMGREFDFDVLLEVLQMDRPSALEAIGQLTQAGLVSSDASAQTYWFRHALIRDAAYESMPGERRRATHRRIAQVLSASSDEAAPAELARHFAGAHQFRDAVTWGLSSANALLERSGNSEAINQADLNAEWLEELDAEEHELSLRNSAVRIHARMALEGWASPSVGEELERCRSLLGPQVSECQTVSTLFSLFMHHHVASQRAACRDVADQLLAYAERRGDPSAVAVAATAQGVSFHAEGDFAAAQHWLERGLSTYCAERDTHGALTYGLDCRSWASAQLALVEWHRGRTDRAFQLAKQAVDWSETIQHMPSLGIALLYTSQIHQFEGDKAAALDSSSRLLEAARAYGLPAFEGYAAAIASWARGEYEGVAGVIQTLERMNCNLILTYYGSFLSDIDMERGRHAAAARHLDHYLGMCDRLNERCFEAELLRRRALCEDHLSNADRGRKRRLLRRSASLARSQGMLRPEVRALCELERDFGLSARELARLERVLAAWPGLRAYRVASRSGEYPATATHPPPTVVGGQ